MKKYMDKLRKNIYINKNLFVFLLVIVIVGVLSGALFSLLLSSGDQKLVSEYLNNFMVNISKSNLKFDLSFINTIIFTLGFALLIWIFGISIIGIILVLPFLFIKSFVLGFSIGSIMINFKLKGIILSLIYIVPHHVINLMVFILISSYAIKVSYSLFMSMKKKKVFDFKLFMNRYTFILVFSLIILFISSLYEVFVMPRFMSFVYNLLN